MFFFLISRKKKSEFHSRRAQSILNKKQWNVLWKDGIPARSYPGFMSVFRYRFSRQFQQQYVSTSVQEQPSSAAKQEKFSKIFLHGIEKLTFSQESLPKQLSVEWSYLEILCTDSNVNLFKWEWFQRIRESIWLNWLTTESKILVLHNSRVMKTKA